MRVQFLRQEDRLEKEMATHSSLLALRISRTEEPSGLQSMGLQRVGHDSAANTFKARGGSSKGQRTVPPTTPAFPLSNTRSFEQAQTLPPPSVHNGILVNEIIKFCNNMDELKCIICNEVSHTEKYCVLSLICDLKPFLQ